MSVWSFTLKCGWPGLLLQPLGLREASERTSNALSSFNCVQRNANGALANVPTRGAPAPVGGLSHESGANWILMHVGKFLLDLPLTVNLKRIALGLPKFVAKAELGEVARCMLSIPAAKPEAADSLPSVQESRQRWESGSQRRICTWSGMSTKPTHFAENASS